MVEIHGECTSGFTPVREAFAANFAEGRELGAAVCVYRDGRPVVNLWAGDTGPGGAPWRSGTIAPIASATKGMVAAAAMILVDRGQLDLDAPVAAYWPEFAAEGKDRIPVRWVLGHRSGVVAFDPPLTIDDIERGTPVADALAAARPVWEPGRGHGYHSLTMGWLVGEIVRRVTGLSVGRFFAKEVASPLGLDLHLGLPAYEEENLATLVWPTPQQVAAGRRDPAFAELNSALRDPSSLLYRSTIRQRRADRRHPGGRPRLPRGGPLLRRRGNAESLARMYAALIGEVDGVRLVRPETRGPRPRRRIPRPRSGPALPHLLRARLHAARRPHVAGPRHARRVRPSRCHGRVRLRRPRHPARLRVRAQSDVGADRRRRRPRSPPHARRSRLRHRPARPGLIRPLPADRLPADGPQGRGGERMMIGKAVGPSLWFHEHP